MIFIITVIIFFLTYEAIMWGWTIFRHAVWLDEHVRERRIAVSYNILKISSIMASSLSIILWIWWLIVISTSITHGSHIIVCAILISLVQISHIHFFVILARYSCLPRNFWSIFSRYISIMLCKYTNLEDPVISSEDLHVCWGDDYDR